MADTAQRHLSDGEAGLHRDGDKARLVDYLDWNLILEAGRIAAANNSPSEEYPEGKYPDLDGGIPNFKGGIRVTKLLDSAMRHLIAVINRENVDPESGKRHLAHMVCNIAMASWTIENRPDMDDRMSKAPKAPNQLRIAFVQRKNFSADYGETTNCPHCGITCVVDLDRVPYQHKCADCRRVYLITKVGVEVGDVVAAAGQVP